MRKIVLFFGAVIMWTTCTKEEVTPRKFPRLDTKDVTDINNSGVTFHGEVIFAPSPIIDHGFLWSLYSDAMFSDSEKISLGPKTGVGTFSVRLEVTLAEGKPYYVRSYAITENYTVYGDVVSFASLGAQAPVLKSYFPETATWGDTITLVGQSFNAPGAADVVKFNNIVAPFVSKSRDTLRVQVPDDLFAVESVLSVTRLGNTSSHSKSFKLNPPSVESMSPEKGTIGSAVTITGKNLHGMKTKVFVSDKEARLDSGSGKHIKFWIPEGAGPWNRSVRIVTGDDLFVETNFDMVAPEMNAITPSTGDEGDQVSISGNFFPDDKSFVNVFFNGMQAVVQSVTRNEVKVIVPDNVAGLQASVKVQTLSGNTTKEDGFTFFPPEIISFTPTSGEYGTSIEIYGKHFRKGEYNQVYVGDANIWGSAGSTTQISAVLGSLPSQHKSKVRVTYVTQESISTQDFQTRWIRRGSHDPFQAPEASVTSGNNVYCGFSRYAFNTFIHYNSTTNQLQQRSDFPGAQRQSIVGFAASGQVYFGGGYGSGLFQDWWSYNISTNIWTQKANVPLTGYTIAGFTYQNNGYVLELDNDIIKLWKYSASMDTWSQISTTSFAIIEGQNTFVIGANLYVLGSSELWKYNFISNQWALAAALPESLISVFSINNQGYGVGPGALYLFDPSQSSWMQQASPLYYRAPIDQVFPLGTKMVAANQQELIEFDPSY